MFVRVAEQHVEDLIADTSRLGIPIDFISTHFYPSDPNCTSTDPKSNHNGIRGDDPDCPDDDLVDDWDGGADAHGYVGMA